MLHGFFRKIAPLAVVAMSAGMAGCDSTHIRINDTDGVKLADLDMSGKAPDELVLAGPDTVLVSDGAKLSINVDGDADAVAALRFSLKDGTLAIMREGKNWRDMGSATVHVTMPSPKSMTLAGSGTIETASLASDAEVNIVGSGTAKSANLASDKLEITIGGSGTYSAAGTAKTLELTVAGSGSAKLADLKVDGAEVTILGSGDTVFASDGAVKATVMGSGNVTVTGNATCTVKSMGAGTVTCQTVRKDADTKD